MKYIKVDGIEYEVLPYFQRVKKAVVFNPLMNYLIPRWLMLYLLRGSMLFKESLERPGGWRAMEIIYENRPPRNFFDRMAIKYSPFSIAIRNRKKLVNRVLCGLIDRYAHRGKVTIVDVGSGPGTHVIDTMADHDHDEVHAHCIDYDSDAFEYGKEHTREHKLEGRVTYIEGDAREIHEHLKVSPHIVKMIGLLEYLSDDECVEMLRVMYRELIHGGSLITSGLIDRHKQARFLGRIFNWHLNYRDEDYIMRLLEKASFCNFKVTTEPMGIFPVIVAGKK